MVGVHTISMLNVSFHPFILASSLPRSPDWIENFGAVCQLHFTTMTPTYLLGEADDHIQM
jgi:hypothetical protein